METQNQIHVIFGTGPLGLAVMRALTAQQKPVRVVNRSGTAAVPTGVEVIAADAYNPADALRACQGAGVVYQCAQPAYHRWVDLFPPLQASILRAAAQVGAKLILAENLYMYGEVTGKIHEGLAYRAATRKGKVRAQMSQAAFAAHQAGEVRVSAARGSDFFGPFVLGSTLGERAFLPAVKGKTAQLVGALDLPHTYTYIDDFGKAMAMLGEREEALGQAWHVPNPETWTQRQIMKLVFEELGLPPRISTMGKMMMAIGGLFIPEARESVEMAYEFEKPFIVDSTRFEQTFQMHATPMVEAVRQTVAWYRQLA